MDDLLSEFLTETAENLSVLDLELVRLEQNPNDPNLLGNIFRLVHTIKGTCGFLGLPRLESVAHAGENILGKFRDGELPVTPAAVTLILEALDTIKALLGELEATEQEPEGNDADLIARLNAMAEGHGLHDEPGAAPASEAVAEEPEEEEEEAHFPQAMDDPDMNPELWDDDYQPQATGHPEKPAAAPTPEPAPDPVPAPAPSVPATTGTTAPAAGPAEGHPEVKESAVAAQSIRVGVDLLENLMTMVSELVLTRNQLMQILRAQKDSDFAAPLQRLNHVTSELQEGVMKTRMQPIGNAWAKLPRIVRDLCQEMGRKIDLQMIGAETELDRQVLDLIKDPLTHMIRNSADHGIEAPADRVAAGKDETGTIRLNAFHEGGHIIIEINDDGRGLNLQKIKEKAVRNGLATEAELATMPDQQIQQYIFRAGFSTAEKVTSVSGRGVGMDVVRTNIEKIGGTVELKSQEGRGSTFVIKIPLTLAIVSALVVECGGERFAIPQLSVIELVRAGSRSEHSIEALNGTPVLRLRDRLLPLVSLRGLLHLDDDADSGKDMEDAFIVVSQVGAYTFGIIVDRVFDTEEIVVKPVAPILRHIEMFSGNTILGDGSVIMILDPNGIASATGEIHLTDASIGDTKKDRRTSSSQEAVSLLLFRAGAGAPKAVPLALVARLEDIDPREMEISNGQLVVQYRGRLMPLVAFGGYVDAESLVADAKAAEKEEIDRVPVLVFADGDRSMGLMVDEIVDIVEQQINVELASDSSGTLGSAIIAGKATDVIDAGHYLTQAFQDWFGSHSEGFAAGGDRRERVLLVDDSPFFRNMLTPMLSVAGYDVITAESGDEALTIIEGGDEFDAIVSDIEMPGISGFELTRRLRERPDLSELPIIALSSHATPADLEQGREVGFTDYVAKFDRDTLLQTLQSILAEAREARLAQQSRSEDVA